MLCALQAAVSRSVFGSPAPPVINAEPLSNTVNQFALEHLQKIEAETIASLRQTSDQTVNLYACLFQGKEDSAPLSMNLNAFKLKLIEIYGYRLAISALRRFRLEEKEVFTILDLKKALMGIGADIQISDLKRVFSAIKNSSAEMSCKSSLTQAQIAELSKVNEFQNLTPHQIATLLKAIRLIPNGDQRVKIRDACHWDRSYPIRSGFDPFVHDLWVNDSFAIFENPYPEEYKQCSVSAYFAKDLPVLEPSTGAVFSALDKGGNLSYFEVQGRFVQDGLVATLSSEVNVPSEKRVSVHLSFRGTGTDPRHIQAFASVIRNLDHTGIGRSTFLKHRESLGNCLLGLLEKLPSQEVDLVLDGCSLGGVDAQRMCSFIAEKIANEPQKWGKIKSITLSPHNSPRAEHSHSYHLNREFQNALDRINRDHPIRFHLNFYLYRNQNQGDVVQMCGSAFLGYQINSPHVTTRIISIWLKNAANFPEYTLHRLKDLVHNVSNIEQIENIEGDRAQDIFSPSPRNPVYTTFWVNPALLQIFTRYVFQFGGAIYNAFTPADEFADIRH
jgi:hypothetical protein